MPSPRTHGKGTKRDAILAAAVELLLTHGYDGTSMDAVAAEAGVSKTTVYAHFADKDRLFQAVMGHAASVLAPSITDAISAETTDNTERLSLALSAVVQSATAPELIAFFRVMIAERERRRQVFGVLEETKSPDVVSLLTPFLEAVAVERGVELIDAHQWVILLLRLSAPAVQFDILTSDFAPTPQLIEMHARLVVSVFVGGALSRPGRAGLPAGYEDYPWGPAFERR